MNFPNSPSTNDTYTLGSRTWQYDGNAWFLTVKTISTANVPESGNLYFTNARAVAAVGETGFNPFLLAGM